MFLALAAVPGCVAMQEDAAEVLRALGDQALARPETRP